ncbi:MAG: nucleotidyltransferase domain-containing protein, partial [Desulfovibrio sp.]|nr:nucleotidyltransferase domain-containing protein [Desulfovibrio sp.]
MKKDEVCVKAQAMCREHSCRLLYLACFGSTLYGTAIPGTSDLDCKGVFLPSPQSLALGMTQTSLRFSTGDAVSHNGADDVDVDLWSLQYWLLKLLAGGDTGAMDLLYSPSHSGCVLYRSAFMDEIFAEPLKVLNLAGGRSYVGYCLGQAERYCLKGERLGVLKRVRGWLDERHPDLRFGIRLQDVLPGLLQDCGHAEYCHAGTSADGIPALVLNGKIHLEPMPLKEFSQRLDREIAVYGERARRAEASAGLDCKAL